MGDKTSIEWTDATWNPVRGCSRVSPGCENCYAERVAARFSGPGQAYEGLATMHVRKSAVDPRVKHTEPRWTGEVRLVPEHLADPLRWKRPRRIFVNSMSDLFHEKLSNEDIAAVFGVMAAAPQHTFQVLTKRAERMKAWFDWARADDGVGSGVNTCVTAAFGVPVLNEMLTRSDEAREVRGEPGRFDHLIEDPPEWPLPNVWLGVSVEDQRRADERIPLLLETPAAVRFISAEPLLGPVDIGMSTATCDCCVNPGRSNRGPDGRWTSRWVRLRRDVRSDDAPDGLDRDHLHAPAGIYRADSNRHGALSVRVGGNLLGIKPDEFAALPRLDWVIAGAESGPGARPMNLEWVRSIRDQCAAAGVAFFFKQDLLWGKKVKLPVLDGQQHVAYPA